MKRSTWLYGRDLADEAWHHVAIIFYESTFSLFLDNELIEEREGAYQPTEESLRVGMSRYQPSCTSNAYQGSIDDIRVYDYALSGAEVDALFRSNAAVLPSPPTHVEGDDCSKILEIEDSLVDDGSGAEHPFSPFWDKYCTLGCPSNGDVVAGATGTTFTGLRNYLGFKGYTNGVAKYTFHPPFEVIISAKSGGVAGGRWHVSLLQLATDTCIDAGVDCSQFPTGCWIKPSWEGGFGLVDGDILSPPSVSQHKRFPTDSEFHQYKMAVSKSYEVEIYEDGLLVLQSQGVLDYPFIFYAGINDPESSFTLKDFRLRMVQDNLLTCDNDDGLYPSDWETDDYYCTSDNEDDGFLP